MSHPHYPTLLLWLLSSVALWAQPDCTLPPAVPSLLPNPSLELFDPTQQGCGSRQPGGLPDATNQANCLTGWQRASFGTTDAWNAFTLPGAPPNWPGSLPQPIPSGTGLAGFWVGIQEEGGRPINGDGTESRLSREYLAACLVDEQRLGVGQEYRMTFSLGFTSTVRSEAFELGSPGPVTLAIYGIRECSQLYYGDFWDCPEDANAEGWELIRKITVAGQPERWTEVDLSFIASTNYAGIAIGGSCDPDPGSNRERYRNYYFIDEIRLNVPEAFEQPVAGPVAVSGQTICADRVTLTGTDTPGATYQWYKDGTPLTSRTSRELDLDTGPDVDGRYQLQVTTAAGCALSDEVVIQRPIIFDQFADSVALCSVGDTIFISPNTFFGANTYSWSDGSTDPFLAVSQPGRYSVTISNACEQRVESFEVVADAQPSYRVISEPQDACPGDTVTLRFESDWYYPIINWSTLDEDSRESPFLDTLFTRGDSVQFIAQTDSTVIQLYTLAGCALEVDTLVFLTPKIEYTAEVPTLDCENPTGTIRLTFPNAESVDCNWSGPAGEPLGDGSPTLTVTTPGTYRVELLDGSNCPTIDSFTVIFGDDFQAGLRIEDATCGPNGTASVNPDGGTAPYRTDWFASGSDVPLAENQDSIANLSPATYEVLVTDATGCELRLPFTVGAADTLTLSAQVGFEDCENATVAQVTLQATGGVGPYTYTLGDRTQTSPIFDELTAGGYSFTVTDANACTAGPVVATVSLPTPFELSLPEEITVAQGDSVTLDLAISGLSFTDGTVSWSPSLGLSCIDCPDPVARPAITTRYVATFTSAEGCSKTASVIVTVDRRLRFYAPNAFSPDGDGNNDEWRVFFGPTVVALEELRIFDRWGELVWENTSGNPADGWDGTFRGKRLPPAAFAFYGKILLVDGRSEVVSGSLTLIE